MFADVATFSCSKCRQVLEETAFYVVRGRRTSRCRECMKTAMRAMYRTPRGRKTKLDYQYSAATKARRRVRKKTMRASGSPEIIGELCRIRLCNAVAGKVKRPVSAVRDLGCTLEEFHRHLESKFLPGMSWRNRGSIWEIDHIVPFHRVDVGDPFVLRKVCHYSNLRPLYKKDNSARNCRSLLDAELAALGLLLPDGQIIFPVDLAS